MSLSENEFRDLLREAAENAPKPNTSELVQHVLASRSRRRSRTWWTAVGTVTTAAAVGAVAAVTLVPGDSPAHSPAAKPALSSSVAGQALQDSSYLLLPKDTELSSTQGTDLGTTAQTVPLPSTVAADAATGDVFAWIECIGTGTVTATDTSDPATTATCAGPAGLSPAGSSAPASATSPASSVPSSSELSSPSVDTPPATPTSTGALSSAGALSMATVPRDPSEPGASRLALSGSSTAITVTTTSADSTLQWRLIVGASPADDETSPVTCTALHPSTSWLTSGHSPGLGMGVFLPDSTGKSAVVDLLRYTDPNDAFPALVNKSFPGLESVIDASAATFTGAGYIERKLSAGDVEFVHYNASNRPDDLVVLAPHGSYWIAVKRCD